MQQCLTSRQEKGNLKEMVVNTMGMGNIENSKVAREVAFAFQRGVNDGSLICGTLKSSPSFHPKFCDLQQGVGNRV